MQTKYLVQREIIKFTQHRLTLIKELPQTGAFLLLTYTNKLTMPQDNNSLIAIEQVDAIISRYQGYLNPSLNNLELEQPQLSGLTSITKEELLAQAKIPLPTSNIEYEFECLEMDYNLTQLLSDTKELLYTIYYSNDALINAQNKPASVTSNQLSGKAKKATASKNKDKQVNYSLTAIYDNHDLWTPTSLSDHIWQYFKGDVEQLGIVVLATMANRIRGDQLHLHIRQAQDLYAQHLKNNQPCSYNTSSNAFDNKESSQSTPLTSTTTLHYSLKSRDQEFFQQAYSDTYISLYEFNCYLAQLVQQLRPTIQAALQPELSDIDTILVAQDTANDQLINKLDGYHQQIAQLNIKIGSALLARIPELLDHYTYFRQIEGYENLTWLITSACDDGAYSGLTITKPSLISKNKFYTTTPETANTLIDNIALKNKYFSVAVNIFNFFSDYLVVSDDTLVPRGDSANLVEYANEARNYILEKTDTANSNSCRIIDLGTGTGCLGITVAELISKGGNSFYSRSKQPKVVQVDLTLADISEAALKVAYQNLKRLRNRFNGNSTTVKSDWFSSIHSKFDVIMFNPPYIAEPVIPELLQYLTHDPELALYAPESGLLHYKTVFSQLDNYLTDTGICVCEFGYDQKDAVVAIAQSYNLQTRPFKDYGGNWRGAIIHRMGEDFFTDLVLDSDNTEEKDLSPSEINEKFEE